MLLRLMLSVPYDCRILKAQLPLIINFTEEASKCDNFGKHTLDHINRLISIIYKSLLL